MYERQRIGGKYTLEEPLANGGMGTIWVAFDWQLRRRVALKLMTPHYLASPAARHQFKQEAMAVARLNNPHVVQIYDYGIDQDSPYIVMELLDGENLESRLNRQGRLSPAALVPLINQIAKALTSAHAASIIHRDLKPANLFLARVEGEEVVKVLDFGLARLPSNGKLITVHERDWGGTPRYMSPEQLRGEAEVDHRSDLWALGMIIYRALTGAFPFSATTVQELISQSASSPILAPSNVVPELDEAMDAFFGRALHPLPDRRFQSARELAAAFAALVEARPPDRVKVLVIDDEPDMMQLVSGWFRRRKGSTYDFLSASNGEEGLELLHHTPDVAVVLCDINMPKMDGLSFLSKVSAVAPLTKVVIVSAYSDMSNIRMAMNHGAFDFLVKPIDPEDLESTLSKTTKHVADIRRMVRSMEENNLLRQFVHSGIAERLLAVAGSAAVVNEHVEATVAFISVEGLHRAIQQELPDAVMKQLNANLEVFVSELVARGGSVDKFVGQGVIAVFRGPGHAARALDACLAIQERIQTLAVCSADPSPYVYGVSAGLDSGTLISGGVGSSSVGRLDLTVLGEVLNAAVHLGMTALRGEVLLTERLAQQVFESFECTPHGASRLPDRAVTVTTYRLVRRKSGGAGTLDAGVNPLDETSTLR